MTHFPRIAILGAGISGLALARILFVQGLRAEVFERRNRQYIESSNISLDIDTTAKPFAIRCAGLEAEFVRAARYQDQQTRLYDKNANLLFVTTDSGEESRPEIDRSHLLDILIRSIPHALVSWNHEFLAVTKSTDGTWLVAFTNGVIREFDFIVGADGANSAMRGILSRAQPEYIGVTYLEFTISNADIDQPELAHLVGNGMMLALGDRRAIIGHRNAHGNLTIHAALKLDEMSLGPSSRLPDKKSVAAYFKGWSPKLLQLILQSDEGLRERPLYALPVGHRWKHEAGITLVGDAAHLMSPFGGHGANLALHDAADLAAALLQKQNRDSALVQFEDRMFERAEKAGATSRKRVNALFSEDGLEYALKTMRDA